MSGWWWPGTLRRDCAYACVRMCVRARVLFYEQLRLMASQRARHSEYEWMKYPKLIPLHGLGKLATFLGPGRRLRARASHWPAHTSRFFDCQSGVHMMRVPAPLAQLQIQLNSQR